jgi:mono/diheme cytochrome c family protein
VNRLQPCAIGLALSLASSAAADSAVDYMLQCQGCHLADGSGAPGSVPSLAGLARFLAVPGGRDYLVRVPGVAQSPLDDARLAALLNWMLRRFDPQGLPADFADYSEEEVARVRRPPLTDVEGERARLLGLLERGSAR